jgi:hypothetical protein
MHIQPLHQYLLCCFIILEFSFHRSRDGLFNIFFFPISCILLFYSMLDDWLWINVQQRVFLFFTVSTLALRGVWIN